ncbi:hypothetical protein C8R43DRAFT_1144258 [Mycena crocata]|nr:hypothetical protein C8R43DRAFT_1144258 [Mycena crocata]
MSPNTVYVISGASRGIGYQLTAAIAARPDTIVFAGTRSLEAQSLKDLAARHPNVHPVNNNAAAIVDIERIAGRLDVVIAYAGINHHYGLLATTPLSEFRDHWEVNTLGTIVLFQAAPRLLLASPTSAPIFVYMSSIAGALPGSAPKSLLGSSPGTPPGVITVTPREWNLAIFTLSPE